MIVRKARTFLKLMAIMGRLMPLPNKSAKKTFKKDKFCNDFGLAQKLYIYAFLICVGIIIASDLHVYTGDTFMHLKSVILHFDSNHELSSFHLMFVVSIFHFIRGFETVG